MSFLLHRFGKSPADVCHMFEREPMLSPVAATSQSMAVWNSPAFGLIAIGLLQQQYHVGGPVRGEGG